MVTQSLFSTSFRSLMLLGRLSWTLFFIIFQAFSIGLRSGELPGHSKTGIFWSLRNFVTILALWAGAPSCMKWIGKFSKNSVNALPKKLCSFHWNILRKKVQPSPTLISNECSPHDHTIRVFNSLNRIPRVIPRHRTRRTHSFWPCSEHPKSALITKHHFLPLLRCSMSILFAKVKPFFIAAVRRGFFAARQLGRRKSFCRRCRSVLVNTFWSKYGYLYLNSTLVIEGFANTSHFISLSVLGVFFFGALEPSFLWGTVRTVPGGSDAA